MVNHRERVSVRLREVEDYYVGIFTRRPVFCQDFDGSLHLILVNLYRQNSLGGLRFLRCHLRQHVRAHRQVNLIEIIVRIKARQRIAVEEDHTQVSIRRKRHGELQRIGVRRTVHSRDIEQDGIILLDNLHRLTVHLEFCTNLRQYSCTGRKFDLIVVITTIEDIVRVESPLKVLQFLTIQQDIRQLRVIRLVLDIDHHLVVRYFHAIFGCYGERVSQLVVRTNRINIHHHGLEAVIRRVVDDNLASLDGARVIVTSGLELIDDLAVHRDTGQIHAVARFGIDTYGVRVVRSLLTGNQQFCSALIEYAVGDGNHLAFLTCNIGDSRNMRLFAFDTVIR